MKTAVKTKRTAAGRSAISKGVATICSATVEWCFNCKGLTLSALDMELITNALIDNSVDGDLCTITPNGQTVGGWWSIKW
jgi:hypothetical protein